MQPILNIIRWLRSKSTPKKTSRPRLPTLDALDALTGLLPRLRQHADWASRFGEITEQEFVRFIGAMNLLYRQLNTTSGKLQKLDLTLRNADENQALTFSYQLFKKASDHVQSSLELGNTTLESLQGLRSSIGRCENQRGELREKVLLFGLIETGFRMEMAHVQSRGHDESMDLNVTILHLRELQERLAKTSEIAFDDLKRMGENLSIHLKQFEEHSGRMKAHLDSSRGVIRQELESVRKTLEPAGVVTARSAAEMIGVLDSVKSIIVAVQFQDIVRQQLDHVAIGFKDVVLQLEPNAGQEDEERPDVIARLATVHKIARIQLDQIQAAQREVDHAVGSIVGGLEVLYVSQKRLLQDAGELNAIALGALNNFRTRELFEREIHGLNTSGAACSHLHGTLGLMLGKLDSFINEFAHDISNFGYDVKLAVINTQIGSAHVQKGGPLEKLACETDRNAMAFTSLTAGLTANIQAELPPLRDLQERTKAFLSISEREQSDLKGEVGEAARRLNIMIESIGEQSTCAGDDYATLQRQLTEMGSNMEFLDAVRKQFSDAASDCKQIIDITSAYSGSGGEAAAQNLDSLKNNYTMEKERQIHDRASQAIKTGTLSGASSSEPEIFGMEGDDAKAAATPEISPEAGEGDIILFESDAGQSPDAQPYGNEPAESNPNAPAVASRDSEAPAAAKATKEKTTTSVGDSSAFGDGIELF